ncbi:MAG: hypothetical protein IJK66_02055 [Bacilli bacterium]|nr:hypothetical protein [Bacilli bacterium]
MNLTDQTVTGQNEIIIQNALSASLFRLNLKMKSNTVAPNTNDLIVYVDKAASSNPTSERKQYVFNLDDILRYYNGTGDELLQEVNVVENDSLLISKVIRKISSDGTSELLEPVEEELDIADIVLFDGTNYIYTNYSNIEITAIFLKDTDENKMYLSSGIFNGQRDKRALTKDDIYFKDAFTKTQNKLNLEIDNLEAECLTSKNNKFSLDANGNLVVNSITTNGSSGIIDEQTICDLIYPVGSIYMSILNTSPATLFGGTWQRINGYYLYAGTGGNTAGSNTSGTPSTNTSGGPSTNTSGGPSTNTSGSTAITIEQMPSHTHVQNAHRHAQHSDTWMNVTPKDSYVGHASGYNAQAGVSTYYTANATATNQNTGGGKGHTHTLSSHTHTLSSHTHTLGNHTHSVTPLRYEVYMWKRTA